MIFWEIGFCTADDIVEDEIDLPLRQDFALSMSSMSYDVERALEVALKAFCRGNLVTMRDIHVFYHLFTVNHWRHVLETHIAQLRASGLYDTCKHIHVGVVYTRRRDLSELYPVLRDNEKMVLCFSRDLADEPVVWRNPEIRLPDGRIGECETILRMVEYAQRHQSDIDYCFIHSKGVTNPPTKRRKRFPYFVAKGFDPTLSNEEANAFVLRDLSTVISNWREYVKTLASNSFRYYMYNFFWVTGELLHHFDFDGYVQGHREFAPPQQRPHRLGIDSNTARHIFSLFPMKLYAIRHGIALVKPPYSYFDVAM